MISTAPAVREAAPAANPALSPVAAPASHRVGGRLPAPQGVEGGGVVWPYLISVGLCHAVALLAFWPYFFSWTGVCAALAGLYVFGTLGINLCYHRLLTHRSFACPLWLEHIFAVLGVCCLQDTPTRWVAIHRMHHQHSDEQPDPHSPLVTLLWGHMSWLFFENREVNTIDSYDRYARDVLRDPFYMAFERNVLWVWVNLAQCVVFFAAGYGLGYALTGTSSGALQLGSSLLIWGVFVRLVLVWHITWSVNSLSHAWGYRSYETGENSRNNWFVALISNGEGWHNNHHADQRSAAHGHRWWELDVTYMTIRVLSALGLARDCILPNARRLNQVALGESAEDLSAR